MGADGAGSPVTTVDHVWANIRAYLPGSQVEAACQLGGDRLGPHLAELARLALVVGRDVRPGPGWGAVCGVAARAPVADESFDLVVVDELGRAEGPPSQVLDEARRLCRPTGSIVVGLQPSLVLRTQRLWGCLQPPRGVLLTALPSTRRPAFLLKPSDREAARYFVDRMAFAYRDPRAAGMGARLQQLRSHAALAAPAAVAVRAAPGRIAVLSEASAPPTLLDGLLALVRSSWRDLGLPGRPPARLGTLVVGHRRPTTGMMTVLLFRPGDADPALVAKLPRYGCSAAALQREADALERVWQVLTGPVRQALPRPLGIHDIDGTQVLLQTGVSGRHLVAETASARLSPGLLARQLDQVLSWSLAMQAASCRTVSVDDAIIDATLEPLAVAALAAVDNDPRVGSLLDKALSQARRLAGSSLPMVVSHGDYWAGNVLVDRQRVRGVVDWERACVDDLPIWDLVKAVGSAAYHLDRYRSLPRRGAGAIPAWGDLGPWCGVADQQFGAGFRAAFVEPGWLATTAREALTGAFHQGGIPPEWLSVAIPFYLVRQVNQSADSSRSVSGWGSVLRALATWPGTWADEVVG